LVAASAQNAYQTATFSRVKIAGSKSAAIRAISWAAASVPAAAMISWLIRSYSTTRYSSVS
jgi:hypothetical protein